MSDVLDGFTWDEALDEELESSKKLSQEISDAENVRTPSFGSPDSPGSGSAVHDADSLHGDLPAPNGSTWWAAVLGAAAQDVESLAEAALLAPKPDRLCVVSACSSCCAESFVLKASSPVSS